MGNPFGITLDDRDLRWAIAENVSEAVIAAICLLDTRSVDEIVTRLTSVELEQVIKIVGRSPRGYAPGAYEALKEQRQRRSIQRSAGGIPPAEGPNSPATPIHPRNGTTRPTDARRPARPSAALRGVREHTADLGASEHSADLGARNVGADHLATAAGGATGRPYPLGSH